MSLDSKYLHVRQRITSTYGEDVSFDLKSKGLRKFGRNDGLQSGVEEMVWITGGVETLPTTNAITHFSSSNAGDSTTLKVEGHTIDGSGNLTFLAEDIILEGQTKKALDFPLARVTRCYNAGSTPVDGTIYIYEDDTVLSGVPQTLSKIHIEVLAVDQQSLKAATSTSSVDYWVITSLKFSIERAQSATVDFKTQIRLSGGVWRTQFTTTVSSSQSTYQFIDEDNPIIVPPNSDVRVMATSNANNVVADAALSGFLGTRI